MTKMAAALLARANELAASFRTRSAEIEQVRYLPNDIAAAMAQAGLYRAPLPPDCGGAGVDPATMLHLIETIAGGDAAAGWCLMIGATAAISAGRLPDRVVHQVFADPLTVTAGVFAPMGRALPEDGQWRVRGCWGWGSGTRNAHWIFAGCLLMDGPADAEGRPTPRRLPSGQPDVTMMILPAKDVLFHDTWQAMGLCGTGSGDFEVRDVLIPHEHAVSLFSSPVLRPGACFAFPVFALLGLGIAAVALGIAGGALRDFAALAGAKTPQGSSRRLAERATVQAEFAQAEAMVLAARSHLYAMVEAAMAELGPAAAGSAVSLQRRVALRQAATHAAHASAEAVKRLYTLAGGSAVFATSPLQRAFRDVHVTTQHMMTGPATWEVIGRAGLGLPLDDAQI
jgi:alkylation response protein AidB-like acyl-CoA dehydrogenase